MIKHVPSSYARYLMVETWLVQILLVRRKGIYSKARWKRNLNQKCRGEISTNILYNTTPLTFLSCLSVTQHPRTLLENTLFNSQVLVEQSGMIQLALDICQAKTLGLQLCASRSGYANCLFPLYQLLWSVG